MRNSRLQSLLPSGFSGAFNLSSLILGAALIPNATFAQESANADQIAVVKTKQSASTAKAKESAIEVITVTVNKREQNLQDVAASVDTMDQEYLESAAVETFQDVAALIPGVSIEQHDEMRSSQITIRGIGTPQNSIGVEPSTTMMIDGEVLARSSMMNGNLSDIERVEVLKGPQGTLFGKNTSAGIIHYVTKRPNLDEFEGSMRLQTTSDSENRFNAVVSGPINDEMAYRLTGYYKHRDPWLKNAHPLRSDKGAEESYGLRGQMLFLPNDDFEILIRGEVSDMDSTSGGSAILALYYPDISVIKLSNPDVGWGVSTTTADDFNDKHMEHQAFSVEANWFIDDYTLTYQGSYRDWSLSGNSDPDGLAVILSEKYFAGTNTAKVSQHELRLTYTAGGDYDFVTGLFFYDADIGRKAEELRCNMSNERLDPSKITIFDPETLHVTDCNSSGEIYSELTTNSLDTRVTSQNAAIFGQFDYRFSDDLSAIVGARYLREKSERRYLGGRLDVSPEQRHSTEDSAFIGKLGLQYYFADNFMTYMTYSTGYKGAGWNTVVNMTPESLSQKLDLAKPEKSVQREIGFRTDWFDRKLQVNVTGYQTFYNDFQNNIRTLNSNGDFFNTFTNAEQIETKGVDVTVTAKPVRGLKLSASVSYNRATYNKYDTLTDCPTALEGTSECYLYSWNKIKDDGTIIAKTDYFIDLEGKTLPNAPKLAYRLDGKYWFEEFLGGYKASIQGTYRWKAENQKRHDYDPRTIHPAYGIFNFSLGLKSPSDKYSFNLYVKNLFEETYYTSLVLRSAKDGGGVRGTIPRDLNRYAGLTMTMKF